MNRTTSVLAALVACVGMASSSLAQEHPGKKPTGTPSKGEHPKGEHPKADNKPEGMGQDAMMQAWMESATPNANHAHLMKAVGTWEGKTKWWMAPGTPPSESTVTTTIVSIMDGRFTKLDTKGQMDMGGMPMPFTGMGIYGYNNTTKKFESVWCDNLGTMMMVFEGEMGADGKSITWKSNFIDPMTKKPTTMRIVDTYTSETTATMEMYGPGPDGKEFKSMQIDYVRKGSAANVTPANGKPATDPMHDPAKTTPGDAKKPSAPKGH